MMWKGANSSYNNSLKRGSNIVPSSPNDRQLLKRMAIESDTMPLSLSSHQSSRSSRRQSSSSSTAQKMMAQSQKQTLPPSTLIRLLQISVTANMGGLLSGTHLALFSGILENTNFVNTFTGNGILSSSSKSIITASLIAGFCLFSPSAGKIVDKYGRKPSLLLSASLFASASCITLLAGKRQFIVVLGRLIAGGGYSMANVVCPMYTAEIAPPSMRGMLVNLYQLSITVGILFAQICNLIFADSKWSAPVVCSVVPAFIMIVLVWISVPESPTWISSRDTRNNGNNNVNNGNNSSNNSSNSSNNEIMSTTTAAPTPINTFDLDVEDPTSISTTSTKSAATAIEQQQLTTTTPLSPPPSPPPPSHSSTELTLREVLSNPSARRRLVIGAGLCTFQQVSGINAVIFFGPKLVSDVLNWKGTHSSLQAASVIGSANVIATIVSILLVDNYGRRQLLLSGGVPMIVSLITLGAMRSGILQPHATTGITALLMYVSAFAISYGPLPFVICSEIFPVRYKGIGMSFCSAVLGGFSLTVGLTFLPMLEIFGGGVYWLYAFFMVGATLFVWKLVPETRKLSLQEIDDLLEQKVNN